MRVMTFPQWFELLENVFESFLLFLQRVKVGHTQPPVLVPVPVLDELRPSRWNDHIYLTRR